MIIDPISAPLPPEVTWRALASAVARLDRLRYCFNVMAAPDDPLRQYVEEQLMDLDRWMDDMADKATIAMLDHELQKKQKARAAMEVVAV